MEKDAFGIIAKTGCGFCGKTNVYRSKWLDPQNRQVEICYDCLINKMTKAVEGHIKNPMPEELKKLEGKNENRGEEKPNSEVV